MGNDIPTDDVNSDQPVLWQQWDDAPTDEIDVDEFDLWIDNYRRRLLRTPFPGRTGNRNRSVLLSLTAVMLEQRERAITTTYPDLVRVCAADDKTVRAGIQDLRNAGHLRCLGCGPLVRVRSNDNKSKARLHRFALMMDQLAPDEEALPVPSMPLERATTGNFAHDAFGGRRGIKRTDLALVRWLAEYPGATRYEAGKSGVVSCATAYRVIDRLARNGIVRVDGGQCYLVDDRHESGMLQSVVEQKFLHGSMERRVDHAIYPFHEGDDAIHRRENPPGASGKWGMPK